MKPKKVLILIDRLGRGGIAQVAMNVALTINRDKYEPIICTTRDTPRNGQDELLRNAGVHLVELNRQTRLQMFSWKPLLDLLPEVTILHSHASGSNFWGRVWGSMYRVPIVITQEHAAVTEKKRVSRILDRGLAPLSDKILTVSQYDQVQYVEQQKLPPNKVETVYVGIDLDKFTVRESKKEARAKIGFAKDKWLIGMIARLAPQKNHNGFFEALTLLPQEIKSNMHCLLIGSGDLKGELEQKASKLGLKDSISFLGERSDIPDVLTALDLFVLPSFWECLPSVVSEAMAMECPVVATRVGGVPEMIGDVGWPLVEPNDTAALSQAILDVWQLSPEERKCRVTAGRQRVEEVFNLKTAVIRLEALYDSLLVQAK